MTVDKFEPSDLQLQYWSRGDLYGQHDELPVQSWAVEVHLVRMNDSTAEVDDIVIGRAAAVVVDLLDAEAEVGGVAGVLDAMSSDLSEFHWIYDPETGEWSEDLDLQGWESAALIIDNITIDIGYRGQGLGPLILAAIIKYLGRGCSFAAIYPCPAGEPVKGKSREQAIASLEKTWQTVGFNHFRDGVWVLDLATRTFDDHWARLHTSDKH